MGVRIEMSEKKRKRSKEKEAQRASVAWPDRLSACASFPF